MEFDSRKYLLTGKLILLKAMKDLYPQYKLEIVNSLNNGVYIISNKRESLDICEVEKIKKRMSEIINQKIEIKKSSIDSESISEKDFRDLPKELRELLGNVGIVSFYKYELENFNGYFVEELYDKTELVKEFELYKYKDGMILKTPKIINGEIKIPEMIDDEKISKIYDENYNWNKIMKLSCVGNLNRINLEGKMIELIRINETLHNKKIAQIAEEIFINKNKKVATISGPSSSGKTTFSKKLELQLLALGLKPIVISLDNYYIGREELPLDENGERNFEIISAIDTKLLNLNVRDLLKGIETEIPRYSFFTGKREEVGEKIKLEENGIIILEGIHGLNKKLLEDIKKDKVYKIYISCLTQLKINSYNRIKTSMVRKMRRIVRDSISRGFKAETTLAMWDKVRKGESENIFPYQEDADIIFDTSLSYEIGVLKPYVEKELIKVKKDNEYYLEARKMLRLLSYFMTIPANFIPQDSILKEFIGGSQFYEY